MTFTLPMMIARLSESAVSSLAGGAVAAWIAGASRYGRWAALGSGLVLLLFVPAQRGMRVGGEGAGFRVKPGMTIYV